MLWKNLLRRKTIESIHEDLDAASSDSKMHKSLGLFDLVCFGIAAIVGAGIFATIGTASVKGGPAVCLLFILVAIACLFSALCYAEFASSIPISGSAYTYSYAAFGEFIAWIIGWNLLMEYAIGNGVLAFSWSDYFTSFIEGMRLPFWPDVHISIPEFFKTDYYSCWQAHSISQRLADGGLDLSQLVAWYDEIQVAKGSLSEEALQQLPVYQSFQVFSPDKYGVKADQLAATEKLLAVWNNAPLFYGNRCIVDIPALGINLFVTILVYIGIRESKFASNLMVMLKLAVVMLVIAVGVFYVKPENWSPFAPNGMSGVLEGIASVFFAYIGFDAISTTAEECKNPSRDLPRATVLTLIVCTLLYIAIALVLTGMVSYKELGVSDPLAFVFERYHLNLMAGIVSFSAVIAITSVFLVFQMGQPRIWMSMSRDGLIPPQFARIHPRFKTPSFSTIVTGIVVALPILFLNQQVVTDLCSIGTLFAFMLVSAGVLMLEQDAGRIKHASFRVPYINSRYFVPAMFLAYTLALHPLKHLAGFSWDDILPRIFEKSWEELLPQLPSDHNFFLLFESGHESSLGLDWKKGPYFVFYLVFLLFAILSARFRWSAIPVLGVLINLYLIAGLGYENWIRFIVWCLIGIAVYFVYGYSHSRLSGKEKLDT